MKIHANARTCPNSRRLLVRRVEEEGWSLMAAGEPVLCRWRSADPQLVLDVMPTDAGILGFSNPWYEEAIATAETPADRCHLDRPVDEGRVPA